MEKENRAALRYLYIFQACSAQLFLWMNIEELKSALSKITIKLAAQCRKTISLPTSQGTPSHVHAIKKPECLIHRGKTLQVERS